MGLSIIIIHYNQDSLTNRCVESILNFNDTSSTEILIVDNGSDTRFTPKESWHSHDISILRLDRNSGYAKAANHGIGKSTKPFILIMNNDVEFVEPGLSKCIEKFHRDQQLGALSCRLNYPSGKAQPVANRFPSIQKELIELFRLQKLNPRGDWLLGSYHNQEKSAYCDWIWGTFVLTKRENLDLLPGKKLDERFFMYFEDVVWGYQFRSIGKKVLYFPEFSVVHHHSVSSDTSLGSESKKNLMVENEKSFLLVTRGSIYSFFLYLVRALNFISHPSRSNLKLARRWLKMAF